jgi:D-threonate/D-erythronate kinase
MTGSPRPLTASPRIGIVGDDLTGAADAAAPFAGRGLTVSVALTADPSPAPDVDVLAVVTDSRWRAAPQAGDAVRAAVVGLRAWDPAMLFVKIDSTLRGRVREDVSVALDAWGAGCAIATPAFPAQGRVVRGGSLEVHGRTVVDRVADCFPPGVRVVDAVSCEDLLDVARDVVGRGAVAVGSGGLARALADVLVVTDPPARDWPTSTRPRGVLLVVGTPHPVTREQGAAVVDGGALPVVVSRSAAPPVAAVAAALAEGRRVLLSCDPGAVVEPDSAAAVALAEEIAGTVRAIVERAPEAGLVLTGGATALAVAFALGATELRLRREVSEGLPLGELVTGSRRVPVVTKSGGFGDRHALTRAAEALEAWR